MPTGDVKLVIEGRTASNPPAGYYFPEMVMDMTIKPGVANTVMGSMVTDQQQQANATNLGVYLPRVETAILQTVSGTSPTTIGIKTPGAAQNLTPQQQQEIKLVVQPNSMIGADGQKMSSAQIGISTVPPQLVMDMLPPGVLQHTFDITIQALGVTTFSTPVQMTLPNIFNAAPGTKLNFLSFDHTTGRLEIDGTATLSADGKTVTTEPGTGITHAGWHGLTPPGTDANDDPDPNPDPNNICNDPRYSRLLDENYSPAVELPIAQLEADDEYALQPLGTTGTGPLAVGLPYANEDNYQVTIPADHLPEGFDPSAFLETWPETMNAVPEPGSSAASWFQNINSFGTSAPPVTPGTVVPINIVGYPDTAYVMMTDRESNCFRFSTMTDLIQATGGTVGVVHPVSGSREFGFTQNADGSVTFYMRGLDSPTNWGVEALGKWAQKAGRTDFMEGLAERFGYTPDEAAQMLVSESHSIDNDPTCHTPPGGDPMQVMPMANPANPAPQQPGSHQEYWRIALQTGTTTPH